ncbi:MAG: hypothetical protein AAGD88_14550 [Bacteroidota bacterium]
MIKGRAKAAVNIAKVCSASESEKTSMSKPNRKATNKKTALFSLMGYQYKKIT